MCFGMILPKVILQSQDTKVSGFEGPQDGFFSFSSGGYLEKGESVRNFSSRVHATLYPTVSVRRSVGWLVGPSVRR